MLHDLIADADAHGAAGRPFPGGGRTTRTRPAGSHHDGWRTRARGQGVHEPTVVLRSFADAHEAAAVAGSCRAMLARHIDPPALLDSVVAVLTAKVMDEAVGDLLFAAIPGEPRVSARCFDQLVRAALERLRRATAPLEWPEVEVPELVAHQILRDLGPYSMLATATEPDGPRILRALFEGAIGDDRAAVGPSVLHDPLVAARLWDLVPEPPSSPALGTVAAAAAGVFAGSGGAADDTIVDLREPRPS